MSRANPDSLRPVFVEWEDATGLSGWQKIDVVKEMAKEGCPCETVGFLLEKTEKYVLLAMCVSESGPGEVYRIPAHVIKRVKNLK